MSYGITTLIVFSLTLLNVTTHLVCGVLLLWKRREMPDRSRTILALPWLLAVAVFVNKMLMLPYRWRESGASPVWIRAYVMMICLLAMLPRSATMSTGYVSTLWRKS